MTPRTAPVDPAEAAWRSRIVGQGSEDPRTLIANPRNWRTHPSAQQEALGEVLDRVGWVQQVLVNRVTGHVVDGHLRVELALRQEEPSVPVLYVELSPEEEALVLATLDPLAAMAETGEERLRELLAEVTIDSAELLRRLTSLLPDEPLAGLTDPEAVPPVPDEPWVRPGELWHLGEHRLLCGDATKPGDVARLMGGQTAALLLTDPPYGVAYRDTGEGAWGPAKLARKRAGTLRPRFEAIANDAMEPDELRRFWASFLSVALDHMAPDAAVYTCYASLRAPAVFGAFEDAGLEPRAELVWVKSRPGFNFAHYKHRHEPLLYGCRRGGSVAWYGDRSQTSVLEVASEPGRDYAHPTQKPVALFERPMANSSLRGQVVYDPFAGSGTALIAAQRRGRRCHAMELEPRYVQVAIERWQAYTGKEAQRG